MADRIEPVSGFDLGRYLGTWYEIARLPASFENGLTDVTATYSLNENGTVKVENAGSRSGKRKRAIGKAKVATDKNVAFLRVSFFGPFYADYKVVELDTNYQYAVVASSYKYLWILCREPHMTEGLLTGLVEKANKLGFDTSRLYYTPQKS